MSYRDNYPRVLIIYLSRINKEDQHGVSIRGWFGDWPTENLAQIYSGAEFGEEGFCKYNFKLGQKERRFGKYFFKIKDSSFGKSSYAIMPDKDFPTLKKISYWTVLKNRISNFSINTGLWEIIFKPLLSKELLRFIENFEPQIIYCQGYSLTFTWLPVMVNKRFKIPICFQTGDDWPSELYKSSIISFVMRPIVHRAVRSLLAASTLRFANGKLMADVYCERYKMPFNYIMMCDSFARFCSCVSRRIVGNDILSIVYAGNLGHGRWNSIIDICASARLLENKGFKIIVTAFATSIPQEAINILKELDNLQILPGPSHEDLPSYLKGADLLLLPETLDAKYAKVIRLSISTKAHLYMMAEKPIVVYASSITGIMEYAREQGWACIVTENNLDTLSEKLYKLLTDKKYRDKLVNKGIEVALKNHEANKVRPEFLKSLMDVLKHRSYI